MIWEKKMGGPVMATTKHTIDGMARYLAISTHVPSGRSVIL